MTNSPVIFLFFNRPELTRRVFERIRAARPDRLVLVSDGPRKHVAGEREIVEGLRREIENGVDWPTHIDTDYARTNLGCGRRVSSGIERALSRYGRAIILEDDCLPAPSFFPYCETLLHRFKDELRVRSIAGTYFLGRSRRKVDVGFSHFPCIWGWATWARAWEGYDRELRGWDPSFLDEIAREGHIASFLLEAWQHWYNWIVTHIESTWDVQFWMLSLKNRGLSAFPYRNQIENIGAVSGATHTTGRRFCFRRTFCFDGPVVLPNDVCTDPHYERYLQEEFYSNKTTWRSLPWKVRYKCRQYYLQFLRRLGKTSDGAAASGQVVSEESRSVPNATDWQVS